MTGTSTTGTNMTDAAPPVPPHPLAVFKTALRAHWLGDPALAAALAGRILDAAPATGSLPMLVSGEAETEPGPGGLHVRLALLLVVEGQGTAALLVLLARLEARLASLPAAAPPCRIVAPALATARIAHRPETGRSEARLTIRAFVDFAATEE